MPIQPNYFEVAKGITRQHADLRLLVPLRRTFAAKDQSSPLREQLNLDTLTSEYMPSYRYVVRVPHNNPNQPYISHSFRTKVEAETFIQQEVGK